MAETAALIMAGGAALGAYQAGAYAAMDGQFRNRVSWIAGSSIGAVNGSIIADTLPERRVEGAALPGATTVVHLSYRSAPGEAKPESQFDFSRFNLSSRKQAGAEDMAQAMDLVRDGSDRRGGCVLHHIRRQ